MTDQTSNLIFECWSSNWFSSNSNQKPHTPQKVHLTWDPIILKRNIPKWMEIKLTLFFWRTGVVGTGLLAFPSSTLQRLRPFFRCAAAEDNLELLEPRLETSSGKSSSGAWPRGRVNDRWVIPIERKTGYGICIYPLETWKHSSQHANYLKYRVRTKEKHWYLLQTKTTPLQIWCYIEMLQPFDGYHKLNAAKDLGCFLKCGMPCTSRSQVSWTNTLKTMKVVEWVQHFKKLPYFNLSTLQGMDSHTPPRVQGKSSQSCF